MCSGGKVFKQFGNNCGQRCEQRSGDLDCTVEPHVDGCFCPEGMFLNGTVCIEEDACPCMKGDLSYDVGESILLGCTQ